MVFDKFKELFSASDEKYEILMYKYSKIKLENQKLKEKAKSDVEKHKDKISQEFGLELIKLYRDLENAKRSSFKVKAIDKDTQRLLVDLNKVEKSLVTFMKKFSIEEVEAHERFYDADVHDIASYDDAKGLKAGLVLKTVKKGFKINGKVVEKPKVIVTR